MKKNIRKFPTPAAPADPMIAAFGCSSDDDDLVATPGGDVDSGAGLRRVHASPNAPAVDVYVKSAAAPVVTDLKFAEDSDGFEMADVFVGGTVPELNGNASFGELSPAVQVPPAAERPGSPAPPSVEISEDQASPLVRVVQASPDAHRVDAGFWDGKSRTPVSVLEDLDLGDAPSDKGGQRRDPDRRRGSVALAADEAEAGARPGRALRRGIEGSGSTGER
jgi:hypothetical protein